MLRFCGQDANAVLQAVVREIVCAEQVHEPPIRRRTESGYRQESVSLFRRFGGRFHQTAQIKAVAEDDAVLDKAVAAFVDLLISPRGMYNTACVCDRNSLGEGVRKFGLVKLLLDRLPQL